jgi:hypothetical protein
MTDSRLTDPVEDGGAPPEGPRRCRFVPCQRCGQDVLYVEQPVNKVFGGKFWCRICLAAMRGDDGKASAIDRQIGLERFLAAFNGPLED